MWRSCTLFLAAIVALGSTTGLQLRTDIELKESHAVPKGWKVPLSFDLIGPKLANHGWNSVRAGRIRLK